MPRTSRLPVWLRVRPSRVRAVEPQGGAKSPVAAALDGESTGSLFFGPPLVRCMRCPLCSAPVRLLAGYEEVGVGWCESCQLGIGSPGDVEEAHDAAYFDSYGDGSAFNRQRVRDAELRVRHIGPANGRRDLLEIGSGAGQFLVAAAKAGWRPVGIEQSAYAVERGPARTLPVHIGLVEDARLDPKSFDVACAWHVVEHIPDPVPALTHVRDALRPGGVIHIEVPNFASVRSGRMGAGWNNLHPHHHAAQHTPRSIQLLLERAGFRDVRIETVTPLADLPPSVKLQPRRQAQRWRYAMVARTPWLRHPSRHDLLRASAIRG